jgi:hypothetical protein
MSSGKPWNEEAVRTLSHSGWKWLVLLTVVVMMQFSAMAQMAGTGAISGTVTDGSGAVVANATVVATSVDTNASTTRSTTSAGDYNITPLTPGTYILTVSAKGFEKYVQEKVTVNALATVAVNIKLSVGGAEQTITVTTEPPVLETSDATIGAVMDNQTYASLPLMMGQGGNNDQRRATDFAYLMPGVQNTYAASSSSNSTSASGGVNGANPNGGTSEIYIDGINLPEADAVGDPRFTWTAFGVDAVDQFQVQTSGFSTQYAGQGVQNYSIKQGGNAFHGSVYEYIRNTVLDAWKPTAKTPTPTGVPVPTGQSCSSATLTASTAWCALGGKKSPEVMNEVGLVFSGPIIKNKLFVFYNYGQFRDQNGPLNKIQTAPTLAMLGYSASSAPLGYADLSGNGQDIYDPGSQTIPNCSGNGSIACNRTKFTNAQIPGNRISAASAYINKFMLPSEVTVAQGTPGNNVLAGYKNGLANWYQGGRIDYNPNEKHQVSLIIAFGRQASTGTNSPPNNTVVNELPPPFTTTQAYTPKTNVDILKDTWAINDHMVNQFAVAYGRYKSLSNGPNIATQYAAAATGLLGLPAGQASAGFPGINFTGGVNSPNNEGGYDWNSKVNNTYTAMDNFQWMRGRHSLTFGAQLAEVQFNYLKNLTYSSPMTYTFSNAQTQGYGAGSALITTSGASFASYMLGAVNTSSVSVGVPGVGSRWLDPSFWFQDDIKLTSKITINAGVRWDIFPSVHEAHDLFTWLNPNGSNDVTGNKGTLEFAGRGSGSYYSGSHTPSPVWYKNLAPRLGVAYNVAPRTVIRASYGLYFARGNWTSGQSSGTPSTVGLVPAAAAAAGVSNGPQFYWDASSCASAAGGNGTTAADGITTCGWTGNINTPTAVLPSGANLGDFAAVETSTLAGANSATMTYFDPYLGSRTPEYENWSLGFERQMTKDMTVSISYVGSEGHFISAPNAMYQRNGKLPESMAAMAGYTVSGTTATACSGITCSAPLISQKATAGNLALASATGFTPANPYSSAATYYAKNYVAQYYENFPQYSGVSDTTSFMGNESWNALEISVRQRASHGLSWALNYTWSKSIDDLGTFRVFDNPHLDRSISAANQPQNLNITAVYQLPIGRGHRFGDNLAYRLLASDWTISGIGLIHSGLPVIVTAAGCPSSSSTTTNLILNTCEPSLVSGQAGRQYSYGKTASGAKANWDSNSANYIGKIQYINPAAFTVLVPGDCAPTGALLSNGQPDLNAYHVSNGQGYNVCNGTELYPPGTAPRVAPLGMYGQHTVDTDLALRRTFPIHQTWKLQLEIDVTNVANHVIYNQPAFQTSSGSTNGVVQAGTNNTTFGTIVGVANLPRDIQGALRISF